MLNRSTPDVFQGLLAGLCVADADILKTEDGFFLLNRSLANILATRDIHDFLDSKGERLSCGSFFDDWFLYAVPNGTGYIYSLLKCREQEHDAKDGAPADGDAPGVTISFISFQCDVLLNCLATPTDENRKKLNGEINRVVARRGQRHHPALKQYFLDPNSQGAYLTAAVYTQHIASCVSDGCLPVPERYREIAQQSVSYKNSAKLARLPSFIETVNQKAGYVVCDHEKIYIENREALNPYEAAVILATHTGNTSVYSFAAEVEYHARFLTAWAKIRIPFFGRSIYDSAVRADMTVDDREFEGPAPFYRWDARIVRRQYALHREKPYLNAVTE